ncbi:protein transport protein Sec24B-like isoform X1 [Sinocyclocheilus anshuiensis]|uniref:Protein transport protein Sec24B-like n=1 Tax=Sinocyclocheilus anshuiensis TaxID=1608454 RepID=A0A671RR50_9TELE|nr:PREDICTED: protein transport protein Sec24B-like isoform X1 [Sinocyclocheilus anshuiensis]
MSTQGYANPNSSVNNYSMSSTQNGGGAAAPCQNGPGQMYPAIYPASSYYSSAPPTAYPTVAGHSAPPTGKIPVSSTGYSGNYYQNSSGPSPYPAPGTHQYSNAPVQSFQQTAPYAMPAGYYEQAYSHPSQGQTQPQPQQLQPSLVPASSGSNLGAPLYPIVSYPSAPGSSQYGTLRSSQTAAGQPPIVSVMPPPPTQSSLQQYSQGIGATPTPAHPGYGAPPLSQTATVNGQSNAVQQHYDQNLHNPMSHHYAAGPPNSQGPDKERPPSGTPGTAVHSSPQHHPGLLYGDRGVNNAISSAAGYHSSSSSDHEEEDEEDEEAGGDSSSTTTGSASPVPNSYESLEGGGYSDLAAPPAGVPAKQAPPFGYNYPTMHPAYQQSPAPKPDPSPSHGGYNPPGYQPYSQPFPSLSELSSALGGLSGVSELEAETLRPMNLLQERNILPPKRAPPPEPNLSNDLRKVNCSPDTFRCTLTNIPQTQALLNKARLPLGLLLHPFRDLTQLPVITSNTIVRCRSCRTYINPFVSFLDQRRWKCNLCYRVNDVPDEFMYNPVTRSYGEPHKRPEVQNSTVEFIASSDYMLRPPQPAVYLFLLDVSHNAVESGYLNVFCQSLLDNLEKLPGDTRTHIGFVTFDSTVHFYNLQEGLSQPQMLVVSDIDDVFIPTHDSLLVNLKESKELVKDLLNALPGMFTHTRETQSALGPALQVAYKLMSPTGGRVSVFQTQLPTLGAGLLQSREDPNLRSSTKNVQHLGPATDFYKKLALDCSGQQIGVDLFLLSSQYSDLATLACVSKYSAGGVFYYPSFHHIHNTAQRQKFQKDLQRYLTRKIGFEAVMRIRCTKGLSIHTFHGNFFVRSTDLLSLANVNPDSGFAVQMSIEESLADTSLACFQAALLYTSSKGKRRIRVHTLCLPVVSQLSEVFAGADIQAISCLLANMAIDRSISSSLSDARDALVNAVVDCLTAYRANGSNIQPSGLIAPAALRLFPLYVLALLKQKALRTGTSTRLDERVFSMCELKSQPLQQIMHMVHPDLYRIDNMTELAALHLNDSVIPQPPLLQLTAEKLTREGAFLMDCGSVMYLWVGKCCNEMFICDVLGFPNYASLPSNMTEIPELQTTYSERTRAFISWLLESRTFHPAFHVVKDDASTKTSFFQHLVEDRTESAFSYYEFLLHVQQQMSK